MTILAGDIKLVASQVMDDVEEGGGAPIATEIVDAVSNAIFNDISEVDRAGGRVSMRKTFVGVKTANRDSYLGANVIVAEPPQDPNVSVTIFSTRDVFDRRESASGRVESYLNAGPEWAGYLYENHIEGQRVIQLFTRTNVAMPPVGRTLLLRADEGLPTQYEQYVRITRVSSEERTFTYNTNQDYQALVVTCDISDALRFDFPGSPADRSFLRNPADSIVRDTVVADAAIYYGAVPLASAAAVTDVEVLTESVYTQLVPNARTETPLTDQFPAGETTTTLATSPRLVQVPEAPYSQRIRIGQENRGFNYVTIVAPLPSPGTVRATFRALGQNYTITDNGDGTMSGSGTGTINYLTGSIAITLDALPDDRSAVVIYWGQKQHYVNRAGDALFRLPEYSFDLEHSGVVPGTFLISWMSDGVLKTATANSAGAISGDATGDVNHVTGLVHIRPTSMIDAGGEFSIDYDWSTQEEESFTGLTPDGTGTVSVTLAQVPVAGSIEVQWLTTRTNTASSGVTSASGSSNKVESSSAVPSVTNVSMVDTTKTYRSWTSEVTKAYTAPIDEATIEIHPGVNPHFPPSYTVTTKEPVVTTTKGNSASGSSSTAAKYSTASTQTSRNSITTAHLATDDGAGSFLGTLGTANYAGKTLQIKVQGDASESSYNSNYENASNWESLNATGESTATVGGGAVATISQGGGGSATAQGGQHSASSVTDVFGSNSLSVRYKTGSITPTSVIGETFTPPAVVVDLCPHTRETIVPGSIQFTWMGVVFQDFEGRLYRDRTPTDPGIHAGGIHYTTGIATIFDYDVSGSASNFVLQSLWTRKPRGHIANLTFSTAIAPIKPGGITLSVVDVEGTQIIATANTSGVITGSHTRGTIDFESGLVEVQFGDYVLDSGLTAAQKAEWWYNADDVRTSDGKIWRPWPVDPETLRYSAVGYFYLPLDADILGLDPVRLPQDGRVVIFRPGGFVVVGHSDVEGPVTVANSDVVNCGRVRLSRVRVIGNDGDVIDTGYTANLDAGTVTFTDVSGYSQPVTVEHRVEDMAVVAEVQITGRLRLTRQLTHDYPVDGSYVASALIAGDLRARVSVTFDQQSWSNVWEDAQSGNAATGTFNDIANPIQTVNSGALTERWAVVFTSTTAFNVIGEHVGVIATGNTSTDCSPLNPASGTPYFTIPALGWGTGWSIGNVLRFNTVGAYFPVWIVRTVQQGPETVTDDTFTILIRGDVDAP